MPARTSSRSLKTLAATSVLSSVLGSVHAFSVFLEPMEAAFGASRAAVSFTYSLALATLTLAVLFGHRFYAAWRPATFVSSLVLLAAGGAFIASLAPSLFVVWLGYGVLFGAANGLGYGFGLQLAAQANPGREGLAMGIVTAAYALGAAVSPPLFALAVDGGGYQMAMIGLAAALIILGGLSAVLLASSGARFLSRPADASSNKTRISDLSLLWIGYGAGVAGGLMVIGHAAGLLAAADTSTPYWAAPVLIAVCNLTGSLVAGWMIDRVSQGVLLIGLPLLSAGALLVLSGSFQEATLIIGLGVVGFAYGGIIAAYPAAIAKFFGMLDSPRIYGRVFTAWGAAGLAAPWLAGFLYDLDGAYFVALTTAGALGCVSSLAAVVFFMRRRPR